VNITNHKASKTVRSLEINNYFLLFEIEKNFLLLDEACSALYFDAAAGLNIAIPGFVVHSECGEFDCKLVSGVV
jgi:hypothetical protein